MNDSPGIIKILLLGEAYHAKVFCEQLENYEKSVFEPKYYSEFPSSDDLEKFEVYHLISSPLPVIQKLKRFRKPIFNHWIGTDVYRIITDNPVKRFFKKNILNSPNVFNLSVSENLQSELKQVNVSSTIIPLTKLKFVSVPPPMPEKFSVLTYIPENRWDFYHGDLILELAENLPEIDFHILAAGKEKKGRSNLFFYDFEKDTIPFYKNCSVLLRITKHDGLPKMVLEALSYGRQVLWSESFPHCINVKSLNDCLAVLNKLKSNCPININGKKFIEESYNETKIIGDYYELCKKLIHSK